MKTIHSTPKKDGFRMPGEYEPHQGTWMLWPVRTDTWRSGAKPAQHAYVEVAKAIATFEPVTMCVPAEQYIHARQLLPDHIRVVEISSNDAWMRDIGPTFVKNDKGEVRGIDWGFNAWGGLDEGLYFPWDLDSAVKQKVLDIEQIDRYDATDFITEGGAIAVDGEGTLITTEQCLLNPNRNTRSKTETEEVLKGYLGVEAIIWIKDGLVGDETDGHIDEVLFFSAPGEVVLSWTDDPAHPQYEVIQAAYEQLKAAKDAKGRQLVIHKMQLPGQIKLTPEESAEIDQIDTSYDRTPDETFLATYINCYICNGGVVIPAFNDPQDEIAKAQFQELFPDRKIVSVYTREVSVGGGNIHCITQQQPAGK